MLKNRLFALLLAAIMILPMFAVSAAADADWAVFLDFDGADEPVPEENLLEWGAMDDDSVLSKWNSHDQKVDHIFTSNGGYLFFHEIPHPATFFDYTHRGTGIGPGTYKFTGYVRTAYEGEVTELRFYIYDQNHAIPSNGVSLVYLYPKSTEWLKVELYVTLDSTFAGFRLGGGPYPEFVQAYCIDNFSLVKVDCVPEGYTHPTSIGTKVTHQEAAASNNGSTNGLVPYDPEAEDQYDVRGIVYNRDIDFIDTCSSSTTRKDLENYVYGFRDTHVTDFMINIFAQIAAYPSEVASDFIDKYRYYKDQGLAVPDNRATVSYILFERKKLDYIDIFCEKFPEIGINPWLSFRMNDSHYIQNPSNVVAWDFFTDNPQYRRVRHGSTTNKTWDNAFDYSHKEVCDYMLAIFNEALDRYDCYGIELDYMREIWLWHTGGEYAGLEILNDFMRDVNALVSVYEEKYGHEIKIAVRCASDIQTNYDFGLDIITWASEGLVDLVTPMTNWGTTDLDTPAGLWASVMHPYGVEVAPGIEYLIQTYEKVASGVFNMDKFAAAAASWYSQGADKVYLYNNFIGLPGIKDSDRVHGMGNHFEVLTTIGSYDKTVNRKRQMLIGYNNTASMWKGISCDLPFIVNANSTGAIRIPIGDVPEGANVTVRMAANSLNLKALPTIYINGVEAKHLGNIVGSNTYTTDKLMIYAVPESVHDDMFLVIEVVPQKYFSSNYIDVIIEPVK